MENGVKQRFFTFMFFPFCENERWKMSVNQSKVERESWNGGDIEEISYEGTRAMWIEEQDRELTS